MLDYSGTIESVPPPATSRDAPIKVKMSDKTTPREFLSFKHTTPAMKAITGEQFVTETTVARG